MISSANGKVLTAKVFLGILWVSLLPFKVILATEHLATDARKLWSRLSAEPSCLQIYFGALL